MRGAIIFDRPGHGRRSWTGADWRVSSQRWAALLAKVGAVVLIVFLSVYNLENYPTTWFDEGSHLHVPKALVQSGVYADTSSEGLRYFGPTTGVGPTVLLPVALAFRVGGIGLLQARIVMVGYLLAAALLFYLAARRMYGSLTAWLALLLLVSAPAIDLFYLGRQVLGEVPALAFLMLGVLFWWKATDSGEKSVWVIWAGVAFGLAALTKSQYALALAPAFVCLLALNRFYYRQLQARFCVIPLAAVLAAEGLGLVIQFLPLIGTSDLSAAISLWREATAGAIFVFSPARTLSSLKFLSGPETLGFWAFPGLVYGAFLARERNLSGVRQAFLLLFAIVGLAWYALGSIGWPRYAFPFLAVTALFSARLFITLALDVGVAARLGLSASRGTQLALVLGLALIVGSPLIESGRAILGASDRSPQLVAEYLNASLPETTVIETWEPELGFLTDHSYHYPPSGWLDRAVRAKWLSAATHWTRTIRSLRPRSPISSWDALPSTPESTCIHCHPGASSCWTR